MSNSNAWARSAFDGMGAVLAECERSVADKKSRGEFTQDEIDYVGALDLRPVKSSLKIDNKRLEKLRRLCQLWEVDIRARGIKSHRPFIGPVIVGVKRMIYPVLKTFLGEFIKEQREFNATLISALIDLNNAEEAQIDEQ